MALPMSVPTALGYALAIVVAITFQDCLCAWLLSRCGCTVCSPGVAALDGGQVDRETTGVERTLQ